MAVIQKTRMIIRYGNRADLKQLATGEFGYAIDTGELFIGAPNLTSQNSGNLIVQTKTNNDYLYSLLNSITDTDSKIYAQPIPLYTINTYNFDEFTGINPVNNYFSGPDIPIITNIDYKLFLGDSILETGKVKIASSGFYEQTSTQYITSSNSDAMSGNVPEGFVLNGNVYCVNDENITLPAGLSLNGNVVMTDGKNNFVNSVNNGGVLCYETGGDNFIPYINKNVEDYGMLWYDSNNHFDNSKNYPCCIPDIYDSNEEIYYTSVEGNDISFSKTKAFVQFLMSYNQEIKTNPDNSTELDTSLKFYGLANINNNSTSPLKLYYKINGEIN